MAEAELSKVLKQADDIRRELLSLGDDLKKTARSFELPKPDEHLVKLLDELDDDTYQVLVIGEAKRGKSTLVNALIGRDLLPTNVDVATSQAFRVRPSDTEAYRLRFEDGSAKEITVEELGRYGSQVFAEGDEIPNRLGEVIRWIEVDVPARFIPKNIRLIDTPGLGSLYASHGQITRRFIPYAHAVIFVLESQAPIGQPEIDILEEVLKHTHNIFFVQTKIDQFEKEAWQSVRRRNEAILRERFSDRLPDVRVWPVSSVNLQKAVETGDPDYEIVSRGREMIRSLQEFLFHVTGWSRLDHALMLLRRYYRDGEELLGYRLRMLEEGEQKLQEAHRELSARGDRLQRDWGGDGRKRRELEKQLDQAINSAAEEFGNALSTIYDDASRKVKSAKSMNELRDLVNSLPQHISEKLQEAWDDILKRYQYFIQDSLKPFSKDMQESTVVPPVSIDGTLVSKSIVPEISEPSSSIDLKPVSQAVVAGLPTIGAGAALVALGNVVPFIGTLFNPVTTPIGVILIGYSLFKILPEFWKARQRALETARNELISHLENEFKKIQKTFLSRLDSPLRQILRQVGERIVGQVDTAVERRLEELAEEMARLDENCRLAAREREEKSARLRGQIVQWKAYALRLDQIENRLKQIQKTRISA
ncbi:MAG: dynamin family protein [Thermogutta sp.]